MPALTKALFSARILACKSIITKGKIAILDGMNAERLFTRMFIVSQL